LEAGKRQVFPGFRPRMVQGCSAIGAWAHCLLMRYSLLPSLNLHS
jgi:hypothetical protein